MDVEAVHDATRRALVSIRAGGGPVFLEFETYRFRAHSMYDPERYRDRSEVEHWRERDPITVLLDRMVADGEVDRHHLVDVEADVDAEIERAIVIADASPYEDPSTLLEHVYAPSTGREGNGV
jgi:pyruvate dehydrogenase E1 component alpha subunit